MNLISIAKTPLTIYMENPWSGEVYTDGFDYIISFALRIEFWGMALILFILFVALVRMLALGGYLNTLGQGRWNNQY